MALDKDYVVDAELPTLTFPPRLLSGLESEVMFHHAEASLQQLIVLVNFV
jgi:hypothetical protein